MVRPDRLERPTFWFVARRSIQLSYGRATLSGYHSLYRRCLPCPAIHVLISGRRLVRALQRLSFYRTLHRGLQRVPLGVELVYDLELHPLRLEGQHLARHRLASQREAPLRSRAGVERHVDLPSAARALPFSFI